MRLYTGFICLTFFATIAADGQAITDSISIDYVKTTLNYLASDQMGGRVNYSIQQLKAAEFIGGEFKKSNLNPFAGQPDYFIPFSFKKEYFNKNETVYWNEREIPDSLFDSFSPELIVPKLVKDSFFVLQATPPLADSLLIQQWNRNERLLIWIKLAEGQNASSVMKNLLVPVNSPAAQILIVADKEEPSRVIFSGNQDKQLLALHNVVGMLPGKSKADEMVIFSAHYDHVNVGIDGLSGKVFNGANDDASGTTAVLSLAKYFSMRNDNKRTLVFCLFAGEELGLLGSRAFNKLINPEEVKAVINIEMIGITNTTGKNAFRITGDEHSDLKKIMRKNLSGVKFRISNFGDDFSMLFQRSDNYPFFLSGIPAHSIMCSDDNDPCYHKPCDDAGRIDTRNMTNVIKAIAKGVTSIVNGTDTPVLSN